MRRVPLAALFACISCVLCSPFDPHEFPSSQKLPYFDGWFFRLTGPNVSASVILGGFKPIGSSSYNTTWAAMMLYKNQKMSTKQFFLDQTMVTISPDASSERGIPSAFDWAASTPQLQGSFAINDSTANLDFKTDSLEISFDMKDRVPWDRSGPDSSGPEGWVGKTLPLPCHYYVHSLGSATNFRIKSDGETVQGQGFTHMETNYGQNFPSGWLWVQGVSADGAVQLMLTGGLFNIGPIPTHTFLLGFRSPDLNLDLRTTDLDVFKHRFNASEGWLEMSARSPLGQTRLSMNVSTPVSTFSDALYFPTPNGFTNIPGAVESYAAQVSIEVTKGSVTQRHVIQLGALEFGGTYRTTS
eukprot:TRINITY_DN14521_c0_g1_i2.p1 TRINITY_DN14521_c0_g1~~TRINITY_DN14521_c0_g1_i2.p1  ORF type:complete len:356 (+),score=53.20 TRINITY_DN14521_c0_g1_i2:176-1243(+)